MAGITANYVSPSGFTVETDRTDEFCADRRIKANCGIDGFKFGTITSSSYSDPDTTVNLTVASNDLTSNLTDVYYGLVSEGSSGSVPIHSHNGDEGSGGGISQLVASDGDPNPALSIDDDGLVFLINGTNINEFSIDGTLADDSDNAVPTEKSVKTYVDKNPYSILTLNETYIGKVMNVTVDDVSAVFGNPLYCDDDFHYERTEADNAATMPCRALSLESGAGLKKVLLEGQICNTSWNWSKGNIYISTTTGELTQIMPFNSCDQVQKVGWALSINTIYFQPDLTVEEIPNIYTFTVVTTSASETFALPLEATGTYDFNINWNDGSSNDITVWNHADTIHPYATPGTHEIAITGTIIGWRFNNGGDCALYHETKSWGPLNPGNSGANFWGCFNHTCTATDIMDLTGVTLLSHIFRDNDSLVKIPSINSWDMSLIEQMAYTFAFSSLFEQNLSGVDISSLVNATGFLSSVTLFVANYDALITSWSAQAQTIVANFHGGNSKYTTGGAVLTARNAWVAKGWTITDGGENVGSELITSAGDRDFSGGQGNWTVTGDITFDNVSMNWGAPGTGDANIITSPLIEGNLYRCEFEIIAFTSGDLYCYLGDGTIKAGIYSPTVRVYTYYFVAGATAPYVNKYRFWSTDFIGKIDNVSLKECL